MRPSSKKQRLCSMPPVTPTGYEVHQVLEDI